MKKNKPGAKEKFGTKSKVLAMRVPNNKYELLKKILTKEVSKFVKK